MVREGKRVAGDPAYDMKQQPRRRSRSPHDEAGIGHMKQAIGTGTGSPIKSALKSPSKHVIHSPPANAVRPVPESPPGFIDAAAGPAEDFQALVMAKFRERERVEQNLVARVAVLEGKATRLEPLEAYTHDLSAIARVKHFVTNEDLLAKLDEVRSEALNPQQELELVKSDLKETNTLLNKLNFVTNEDLLAKLDEVRNESLKPQQELELVKSDLKEYFVLLNNLNEEFKGHVKGAFGIVEERYGTLVKDFERITTSIAVDGTFNHIQLQQNLGNLQDTMSQHAAANIQKVQEIQEVQAKVKAVIDDSTSLKDGLKQVTDRFIQLASSSPSSSTWTPGGTGGGQGPCHGRGAEHGGRLTTLENWMRQCDLGGLIARVARLEAAPQRDGGAGAPGAHAPRPFMQEGSWTGPCGMTPGGQDPHGHHAPPRWPPANDEAPRLEGINWAKLFDHKLADSLAYSYAGDKGGLSWAKKTRGYFISILPDLMPILDWAEKEKTAKISLERVVAETGSCRWMIDCDTRKAGGAVWGFLSSALTGKAQLFFEGTDDLNGFDAWRRIMQHIHQGENVHKGQLRNLVKNPPSIRSLEEIPLGVIRFEKIMTDYKAAGGDVPGTQEMKEDLLKTLPQGFREQLMWHATSDDVTFDQFAEHIKKVSYDLLFLQGKAVDVNNVEVEHQRHHEDHHHGDGDGEGETYEEAMMAVNLRFGKGAGKGGRKGGGKGGGKDGSGSGSRGSGTGDVKCGNCGGNRLTAVCTRPRVPLEDRLCHGCGKPGHISRNCPQKQHSPQKKPVKSVSELPVDFFGCVMEDTDGHFSEVSRRRKNKASPSQITLADFMPKKRLKDPVKLANRYQDLVDESDHSTTSTSTWPRGCHSATGTLGMTSTSSQEVIRDDFVKSPHCATSTSSATTPPGTSSAPTPTSSLTSYDVQGGMGLPADELPSETSREFQRAEGDFDAHLEGLREELKQKIDEPVIRNSAVVTINDILEEKRRKNNVNEPNQARRNDALNNDEFAKIIDEASLKYAEAMGVIDEVLPEEEVLSTNEAKTVYVAADTGAVEHCIGPSDLPGNVVVEPPERERHFVGAQGKGIDHYGKAKVILETITGQYIGNVFQVMDVCRPLHAVSKITDTGHDMLFTKRGAVVVPEGVFNAVLATCEITAKYPRKGGLYVAKMTAKAASEPPNAETPATATFARQGVRQ